jgi:hypothetical protein
MAKLISLSQMKFKPGKKLDFALSPNLFTFELAEIKRNSNLKSNNSILLVYYNSCLDSRLTKLNCARARSTHTAMLA